MSPLPRWLRPRTQTPPPETGGHTTHPAASPPPAAPAAPAEIPPTALDERMMALALEEARLAAAEGEVPVGAVVYRPDPGTQDGQVLARAHNRREADANPAAHAEFLAILEACRAQSDWRLNDATLAVTLEPCPMCAGLIVNARVGRVVYGAPDPKAGACHTLYAITDDPRLNHRPQVIPGVMADEAAELLRSFFRQRRADQRSRRGPGSGSA